MCPCWSNGYSLPSAKQPPSFRRKPESRGDVGQVAALSGNNLQIIGLRIDLVHRYPEIRNREVWEITQQKLPTLLNEVATLLEDD